MADFLERICVPSLDGSKIPSLAMLAAFSLPIETSENEDMDEFYDPIPPHLRRFVLLEHAFLLILDNLGSSALVRAQNISPRLFPSNVFFPNLIECCIRSSDYIHGFRILRTWIADFVGIHTLFGNFVEPTDVWFTSLLLAKDLKRTEQYVTFVASELLQDVSHLSLRGFRQLIGTVEYPPKLNGFSMKTIFVERALSIAFTSAVQRKQPMAAALAKNVNQWSQWLVEQSLIEEEFCSYSAVYAPVARTALLISQSDGCASSAATKSQSDYMAARLAIAFRCLAETRVVKIDGTLQKDIECSASNILRELSATSSATMKSIIVNYPWKTSQLLRIGRILHDSQLYMIGHLFITQALNTLDTLMTDENRMDLNVSRTALFRELEEILYDIEAHSARMPKDPQNM